MATIKSIEEKAKRYDEAMKAAVVAHKDEDRHLKATLERIFPELIESEDERVRKELLSFFIERAKYTEDSTFNGLSSKEIISWFEKQGEHAKFRDSIQVGDKLTLNEDGVLVNLTQLKRVAKKDEKQGEQKPTNIVEPKFKVGDWITNGATKPVQISSIEDDMYYTHNGTIGGDIESMDKDYHLWTIADAKDGDILIDKSNNRECPFIFKETKPSNIKTDVLNPLSVLGYCGIGGGGFTKGSGWGDTANCTYYSANKEQQNLLFQKMKEAGYEWDAEKKELNKVEQKDVIHKELTEFEKAVKQVMEEAIECGDTHNLKADADMLLSLVHKSAWSEEDEKGLSDALWCCKQAASIAKDENDMGNAWYAEHWLKEFKDRVQPQYLTITNEELVQAKKEAYNDALDKIEYHSDTPTFNDGWSAAIWYLKKRTTQPQSTWKPSDEQIKAVKEAACYSSVFSEKTIDNLISLSKDLKKLKE